MTAVVRYWHPTRGGWYQGAEVKRGRTLATIEDLYPTTAKEGQHWVKYKKQHRIPVRNVVYLSDTEFREEQLEEQL